METVTTITAETMCRGTVFFRDNAAHLTCQAAGCEVTVCPDPIVFAKFTHNKDVRNSPDELTRVARLEIPDICPRLADFDIALSLKRLPIGLR